MATQEKTKMKIKSVNVLFIILGVILIVYSLTLIIPLVWGFMTSFKGDFSDFYKNKLGFPKEWLWENYTNAFQGFEAKVWTLDNPPQPKWVPFGEMFVNSLLYALGCSFFATLIPCITGYAMSKFRFKFSDILYTVVLVTMALPIVGSMPSQISVMRTLGLFDTFIGIWIMNASFAGQYTLVFFATFRGVPDSYAEAAEIDGANEFTIMLRVMMPLVLKTFLAVMLIQFVAYWNEYTSAMVYLKTHPTIAYGLWMLNNDSVRGMNGVPMKLTGCMILFLPVFVLYLLFQDKLMGNISMGGIKG